MLEAYLRELEGELARRLPDEDVRARLAEAEAHLRDGVEGRIELGLDAEEAEREAVAAFGSTRQVAEAAVPSAAPRVAPRLRWLASGYALGMAFLLFGWPLRAFYPASVEALFALWAAVGLAFAAAAFRARRPAPAPVALTGAAGAVAVWLTMGLTWIDLEPYGGRGVVPPGGAAEQMREARRGLADREADREALAAGLRALDGPRGVESLRTKGGYRVPVARAMWGYDDRVTFTTVADPTVVEGAWRTVARATRDHLRTDEFHASLAAVPAALADPGYKNLLFVAPSVLGVNLGVAALAVAVDFVFGALGFFVHAVRRRRKGGLRA